MSASKRGQRVGLNAISFSAAMPAMKVTWQCGLLGVRVGETSHPGPVTEDQRQRVRRMADQMILVVPPGCRPT
eukprot:12402323-Karenia_brevis.AAC.1